jgi:GTP-dependent phosphoenolpyruvate carboxykinase
LIRASAPGTAATRCSARSVTPAHRQLAGAHRGMARGAHADCRRRKSARARLTTSAPAHSLRVRQDQSRHADPARLDTKAGKSGRWAMTSRGCTRVKDGRLYAINPESGYFGVVPGTNRQNQSQRLRHDSSRHDLYQCRAHRGRPSPGGKAAEGQPVVDWQGRPYDPANGPAAHPNSRFTVAARRIPVIRKWPTLPGGVPISAIVFGGRRREVAPSRLSGPQLAARRTGGCRSRLGDHRSSHRRGGCRAPRPHGDEAIRGYNFADYWAHWINVGAKLKSPPHIFHVNWFRQNDAGKFLVARLWRKPACAALDHRAMHGEVPVLADTAIGYCRDAGDLDMQGLDLAPGRSKSTVERESGAVAQGIGRGRSPI